jgi:hypothetical protein
LAEERVEQVSLGRTLALRNSDFWEAELVFEAIKPRELAEPSWATHGH